MLARLFTEQFSFAKGDSVVVIGLGRFGSAVGQSLMRLREIVSRPEAKLTQTGVETRAALIDGLGLKPRTAFGALRVAVSGRRVSPPLFESMELLGRDSTLARLRALRASL